MTPASYHSPPPPPASPGNSWLRPVPWAALSPDRIDELRDLMIFG